MKKTLVSALTTALVIGAASTTFAAANPFEDVPADHWAYDAIAQLAADGVIEGYGDGTYRGDQEITRYEMAQMIARAMAKGGGDKALIDKLAAEFADELNNLGVRVSALEKKVDNVKWTGKVTYENYTYFSDASKKGTRTVDQHFKLRFQPKITINDHWSAIARIDYNSDADTAANATLKVDRMWVTGNYDNLTIKLGKIFYSTPYDGSHKGSTTFDSKISGGILTVGNQLKFSVGLGRFDTSQSLGFADLSGQVNDKFGAGVSFFRISKDTRYGENAVYGKNKDGYGYAWDAGVAGGAPYEPFGSRDRNIWRVGFNYKFTPDLVFYASYARSNGDWETKFKQAYSFELAWNGGSYTNLSKPGSFGAFIAYRHLGSGAVIAAVYDAMGIGYTSASTKGFQIGASYTIFKNVQARAIYFNGKDIGVNDDRKAQAFYGAIDCYF